MTFDRKQAMTVTVAEHVAAKPQDHGPEEIRHLARSYLALLDAVREHNPCPAGDLDCENEACHAMRQILDAADEV